MKFFRTKAITYAIALVWFLFALLGKLIPVSTNHHEIVARVFGPEFSSSITMAVGIGELLIALWILSARWPVLCGWFQIVLVITMNCIELTIARDLLLWGPINGVFALIFVGVVYLNLVVAPTTNTRRER